MDEKGRRLDRVGALDHVALGVAQHERGRRDLRPVPAIGIDQEPVASDLPVLVRHGEREMVAHTLVQPEPRRPPKGAGEVDPLLEQAPVGQGDVLPARCWLPDYAGRHRAATGTCEPKLRSAVLPARQRKDATMAARQSGEQKNRGPGDARVQAWRVAHPRQRAEGEEPEAGDRDRPARGWRHQPGEPEAEPGEPAPGPRPRSGVARRPRPKPKVAAARAARRPRPSSWPKPGGAGCRDARPCPRPSSNGRCTARAKRRRSPAAAVLGLVGARGRIRSRILVMAGHLGLFANVRLGFGRARR